MHMSIKTKTILNALEAMEQSSRALVIAPGDDAFRAYKTLSDARAELKVALYMSVPELEVEYEDPNDYVGMGWVGKDGRP
jgi:hypothetical protein